MSALFKKGLFLHIVSHDKREWVRAIKELGYFSGLDFVEVWLEEVDLSPGEIAWLKRRLDLYEILIHAPFINLTLVSSHQSINRATVGILKKTIDIGVKLGAKVVTMHAGAFPLFLDQREVRKIFVTNFRPLLNYAKGKIEIAVENISMKKSTQISYPVLLEELEDIRTLIPEINFTLDVGHCVENGDEFDGFLTKNKSRIKNIHLHNAIRKGGAHFGFNQQGDLKLKSFIKLLEDIGYSGFLSLEVLGERDVKESWKMLLKSL
ncbi:hypothetical protein A2482_01020 [Candidatus Falkowbacteria bacterium RIFOXYC2_FULL_48_21]|uniref:Xylose isomerase-like TIM barrel domain-containing protein n=1 Tax=Candidatus Falkowbacteria bacterium RIFOXYC2_FULL_48_21 TaxID=1798005 RepID=A0A1F5T9B0_9BACT|nr:MAG: hypothetical protein A2482_01020 [Candidatus Falkowbacteria bacterium RIFOXYC2_FULL_48_21]